MNHLLIIQLKKGLHPFLRINVPDDKANEVLDFLATRVDIERMSEGQMVKLMKHLGF